MGGLTGIVGRFHGITSNLGNVRKFNALGEDQGLFISSNLAGPTNIWFDSNGDMLVCDWNGGTVDRFDSDGNYIGAFMTGLNQPEGVAILPSGNYLIGNGGTGAVKEFDTGGVFIQDLIPAGTGDLLTPNAVVLRNNPTGLENISREESILINTVGRIFNSQQTLSQARVEVTDLEGKNVFQGQVRDSVIWDASSVPTGVYLIQIAFEEQVLLERVVVRD